MLSPPLALLRTQSDERLVALAHAGHERAFEAIVERYRKPLLRSCRRILPEARAEDAVQQAFLTAWRALRRGDEVRELGAWLHTVLKTSALQNLRVRAYEYDELRDSLEYNNTPEDEFERRSVMRATLAGLATLPDNQREALLRTAVGDRQEDIAREMGLSHGAVRQLVHRARLQMRTAATAITPLPLAIWLANASGSRAAAPVGERIGELVAGAGTAGVAATVVKAGAVAVVAGSAVTAASPGIVQHISDPLDGMKRAVTERTSDRDDDAAARAGGGDRFTFADASTSASVRRAERAAGLLNGGAGPVRLVVRMGPGSSLFDSIGRPSSPSTSTPTFAPGDQPPATVTDGTQVADVTPGTGSSTQPAKDERPADDVVFDDVGPADKPETTTDPPADPTPTSPVTETPPASDPPAEQPPPDPTPTTPPDPPPADPPPSDGTGNTGDPPGSDPGGGIAQPGDIDTAPEGTGNPAAEPTLEPTPEPSPAADPAQGA